MAIYFFSPSFIFFVKENLNTARFVFCTIISIKPFFLLNLFYKLKSYIVHAVCISLINFTKKRKKWKTKCKSMDLFFFLVDLELRMELERDEEGVLCDCLKQQTQRWIFSAVMVSYGHWISIRLFHSSSIIVLTEKHAHRQLHTECTCLITSCGRNVFFFFLF